jgi:peroxisomal membrane protein 4
MVSPHSSSSAFDISSELSAIIASTISGAQYGVKIRLPHAFVMTLLFRKGNAKEKLYIIIKSTWEHSRNLASFATVYKVSCWVFCCCWGRI